MIDSTASPHFCTLRDMAAFCNTCIIVDCMVIDATNGNINHHQHLHLPRAAQATSKASISPVGKSGRPTAHLAASTMASTISGG